MQATIHGVSKGQARLSDFTFYLGGVKTVRRCSKSFVRHSSYFANDETEAHQKESGLSWDKTRWKIPVRPGYWTGF